MSASDSLFSDEALEETAAAWLCERDDGFTPERAQAFAAWRRSDSRHEAALVRVQAVWDLLGELPNVRAPLEARVGRVEPAPMQRRAGWLARFPQASLAAGLAAALVIGFSAWWMGSPRAAVDERYETDVAAQRRVALSDGSVVDLNKGSQVSVQFSARERRVTLSVGEAHFQVARDAGRPFVVMAGGVTVRAVGTAFNVRLAAEAIDVLVVEGKVEVSQDAAAPVDTPFERPMLGAGDRARVLRDDPAAPPKVEKVAPESIRTLLAWQERMMPFIDMPLREIVIQFNRRNVTQLVLGDPELGESKIGGMIALDQIDAFVRLLEQDGDIVVERRTTDEIVLRRAR